MVEKESARVNDFAFKAAQLLWPCDVNLLSLTGRHKI